MGVSAEAGEVESRVGDLQPMDDMDDMDDEDFDEDLYSANEIASELGFHDSVRLPQMIEWLLVSFSTRRLWMKPVKLGGPRSV